MGRLTTGHLRHKIITGFNPIGQRITQVHQRVTKGCQFPVQHGVNMGNIVRVQHQVIEPEVIVGQADVLFRRQVAFQPVDDVFTRRHIPGFGFLIARAPATDLPFGVPFSFTQMIETCLFIVNAVQRYQAVEHILTQLLALCFADVQPPWKMLTRNHPGDFLHDIKVAANQIFIIAIAHHGRHIIVNRF